MKGLFLKDLYMARRYCRSYLVIALLFYGQDWLYSQTD